MWRGLQEEYRAPNVERGPRRPRSPASGSRGTRLVRGKPVLREPAAAQTEPGAPRAAPSRLGGAAQPPRASLPAGLQRGVDGPPRYSRAIWEGGRRGTQIWVPAAGRVAMQKTGLGACDEGACTKPSNLGRCPSWRRREPVDAPSRPSSLRSAGSRQVAQGPGSRLGGHLPPGRCAPERPSSLRRPGDPQRRKVPRGPGSLKPREFKNTCARPHLKPMKAVSGLGRRHCVF